LNISGLWPRQQPRPTKSTAEYSVYKALSQQLPKNWSVWHSLRIRTEDNFEGEGDFIIAITDRGFLVLEVKGGAIEQRDGCWFQNGYPLDHSPREQAYSYANKLLGRLPSVHNKTVPFGILTIFPDIHSSSLPTQDNLRDLILTGLDLPYLKESITAKLDKAFPENFHVPDCNWRSKLHSLWGETWIPEISLGQKKKISAEKRYQLDQRQIEIIDALADNRELLIEGVAGSGKTVLAREAATRIAAQGKSVQMLCFTDALANWLDKSLQGTTIQVATVPRFAAELLLEQGQIKTIPTSPAAWAEISMTAAADALPLLQIRPDFIIVDEAQDLAENEWLLIEELAKEAKIWIFYDPAQAFWDDRKLPTWVNDMFSFKLNRCYRCPAEIFEFSKAISQREHNSELVKTGFKKESIQIIECPSESSIPSKIENEINKLLSAGFDKHDIAIISLRGQIAGSIATLGKIGQTKVVRADSTESENNIIADTFLRFKGLERPAVIITDYRLLQNKINLRMHIALTRALDVVRIVGIEVKGIGKSWNKEG